MQSTLRQHNALVANAVSKYGFRALGYSAARRRGGAAARRQYPFGGPVSVRPSRKNVRPADEVERAAAPFAAISAVHCRAEFGPARFERTCVDAPVDASSFFSRLSKLGQVLSCVRPLDAARHTPRALMEMRGPGPNRLPELESSPFGCWFSRSRLVDRLPLPVLRLPASPTATRASPPSQAASSAGAR